ncbi:MAG TPA: alpha/beta hydrolase, partial [Caulobacteraceae bacterium]
MHVDRRGLIGLGATLAATPALGQAPTPAPADPSEVHPIWPNGAPGGEAVTVAEEVHERSRDASFHDRYVTGVRRPSLTVQRPARPNGAAVLLIPGGGYSWVVLDKEGFDIARPLADEGVTSFVLRHRLPHQGWAAGADTPLQDAQRALRFIRGNAVRLGVDPARVGVLGASAGGHVAASLITRFDAPVYARTDGADDVSARPDFACLMYPVNLMEDPAAHRGSRDNLLGPDQSRARRDAYTPS